ncbi:LysR family transcriptional regulator [Roseateles koreensis]|uniref:LysR family transcriptional regulator n=1 Tax=Roseateles koreensis TaxID=2987526 RepID=A0ABT5KWX4_9BURK|nr:LysR family transcriptional regulator [Roseateles koreensis]MDC8786277.1 LysR family transcriptional regulator [Roseateles koreensis]
MSLNVTHRHIEVFRAVMTAGSVTGAAGLLHTSQPTISRELARLEHLLAYALFERAHGRLKPTARGLALFEEVQRSYQGLDRIHQRAVQLGRSDQAELSLLCLPTLCHALMPGACKSFFAQHANARLSLVPQESPLLEEWMSGQRFDLGLTEQSHAAPGTTLQPLLSWDEVCVLPTGHPLLKRRRLQPADFEGQPFISLAADDSYRQQLDRLFAEHGVQRQLRLETHSANAVCAMVGEGLGLAIVNPLTALMSLKDGLQLRRLSVSVPFQVNALLPQFRPAQALVPDMLGCLRAQISALEASLQSALGPNKP